MHRKDLEIVIMKNLFDFEINFCKIDLWEKVGSNRLYECFLIDPFSSTQIKLCFRDEKSF